LYFDGVDGKWNRIDFVTVLPFYASAQRSSEFETPLPWMLTICLLTVKTFHFI